VSRIGRSGLDWKQCADPTKRLDGRLSETALGVAVDCREIAPLQSRFIPPVKWRSSSAHSRQHFLRAPTR
jgi:hypothetical protein